MAPWPSGGGTFTLLKLARHRLRMGRGQMGHQLVHRLGNADGNKIKVQVIRQIQLRLQPCHQRKMRRGCGTRGGGHG